MRDDIKDKRVNLTLVDLDRVRAEEALPPGMADSLHQVAKLLEENRLENFAVCFDFQDDDGGRMFQTIFWDRNNDIRILLGSVEILKGRLLAKLWEDPDASDTEDPKPFGK